MPAAFPGMKAEAVNDTVESWACGNIDIPFGVVCSYSPTSATDYRNGIIRPGHGTHYVGISLHDHLIAAKQIYKRGDAVNIMVKGKCWAKLHDDADANLIFPHQPVFFSFNTGEILDPGAPPSLSNTSIRSLVRSVPTFNGTLRIVMVELDFTFFSNVVLM